MPAAMVTLYLVAAGKRTSGSKRRVLVPIQRHLPLGWGERVTGTPSATLSACEVMATMGWLKVIERSGATGTSPSGAKRVTLSSVPATVAAGGLRPASGGGKAPLITLPVWGGGSDFSRRAKSVRSVFSPTRAGMRARSWVASASLILAAGATRGRSPSGPPPGLPSLSLTARPGGRVLELDQHLVDRRRRAGWQRWSPGPGAGSGSSPRGRSTG